MIRCFVSQHGQAQEVDQVSLVGAIQDPENLVWVDVEAPTEQDGAFLSQNFGFHPLSIEDCLSPRLRPPKLDDFGPYLFLVVHGIDHNLPPGALDTHELDMFLGPNYLVTSHRRPSQSIRRAQANCVQKPALMTSPDSLVHYIIDSQVDNMLPPVEEIAQLLTKLKREILREPRTAQLYNALDLQERLLKVRRVIEPEMRTLQDLGRRGEPLVHESVRTYLKDVEDHLERLRDMLDMLHDMAEGNLGLYMSVTANRTAEFTKALSLVAMMFLPLALVVGIYGMNFKNMPELDWKYGYYVILALIAVTGLGLLVLYRNKHWI